MEIDRIWGGAAALSLAVILVCGGVSLPSFAILTLFAILGIGLTILGSFRLFRSELNLRTKWAFTIIFLGLVLLAVQTIPLPPSIWSAFPGRAFVSESYQAAGIPLGWAALSLDPEQTRMDLLMTVSAFGLFVAAVTLKSTQRKYLAMVILAAVLVSILLGVAQKFQGPNSLLFVYDLGGSLVASGFFANRNFYAALLYSALPFVIAFAINFSRNGKAQKIVGPAFALIFIVIIIIGLGVAESRMGVILAFFALLLSLPLIWSSRSFNMGSRGFVILMFIAVFLIAQFGLVAVLRLASTDSVSEYRTTIYAVSLDVLRSVFPVGSGFGSFVPIYAMHETPSVAVSAYINHAHNDWLELVIEGGLPMAILLLAYVTWYASATYKVWTRGRDSLEDMLVKASSISIALLLCHSMVDYPLRTPALLGLFALLNGFLACGPQPVVAKFQRQRSDTKAPVEMPREAAIGAFKSNFKTKKSPPKFDG